MKNNPKGRGKNLLFTALEAIGDTAIDFAALTIAVVSSPYGSSFKRLDYEHEKIKSELRKVLKGGDNDNCKRRKCHNLVYRLKKDGLINESGNGKGNKKYNLTKKGKGMLSALRDGKILPNIRYEKESGDRFVIVIFDIPENERKKRNWMREVLKNLDFNMEQKSVWIGKTRIPEVLIEDLFRLRIAGYIKIFEITKKGNLEHII